VRPPIAAQLGGIQKFVRPGHFASRIMPRAVSSFAAACDPNRACSAFVLSVFNCSNSGAGNSPQRLAAML
jgi:hypothetical protein